jgi:hypothetical protein
MRSKITNQQFDAEIVRVAEVADRARDLALQSVERVRRFAGGAAVREMARLAARDGAEAPATVARAANMLAQGRTITRLREDLQTVQIGKRVKPDTIVLGKIVTSTGRPAKGMRVVVATDTGKAVGEALVDAAGLFAIDRPRAEFDKLVDGARALVVAVQDSAGKTLFKTSVAVRKTGAIVINVDLGSGGPVRPDPEPDPKPDPKPRELSDIRGLGEARITRLAEAGIKTVADLAKMEPQALATLLRVSLDQATDFIKQARG